MMAFVRLEILAEGRPIRLGARAFKVQMALIEASGTVVGKGRDFDPGRHNQRPSRPHTRRPYRPSR